VQELRELMELSRELTQMYHQQRVPAQTGFPRSFSSLKNLKIFSAREK